MFIPPTKLTNPIVVPFSSPREEMLQDANTLFEQGDYLKVLELVEDVLSKHPENLNALELKSNCLFKLGRYEEAIEGFERVLKGKRTYHRQHKTVFRLAECHIQLKNYEKGFSLLENYQSFNPTCKRLRGWLKIHLIPELSKKIEGNKNDPIYTAYRAYAYLLAFKFKECCEDLFSVFSITQFHPVAIEVFFKKDSIIRDLSLGKFHMSGPLSNDQLSKFILKYQFNLENYSFIDSCKRSDCPNLLVLKAAFDFKNHRNEEGINAIKQSYQTHFKEADDYSERGIVLAFLAPKQSDLPSPLNDFEQALALNPHHLPTKKAYLFHFLEENQYEKALEYLTELEEYYQQVEEALHPSISLEESQFKKEEKRRRIEAILSGYSDFNEVKEKYSKSLLIYLKKYPFFMTFVEWSYLGLSALKVEIERFIQQEKRIIQKNLLPLIEDERVPSPLQKAESPSNEWHQNYLKGGYLEPEKIFKIANTYLQISDYENLFNYLEDYQPFHPLSEELKKWVNTHLISEFNQLVTKNPQQLNLIAWRALSYALAGNFNQSSEDLHSIMSKDPAHTLGALILMKKTLLDDAPDEFVVICRTDAILPKPECLKTVLNFCLIEKQYEYIDYVLPLFNSPSFILIEALMDFRKEKIEEGLLKIKESYNYHFDDPDFYCQRAILLFYFVKESENFPSPLDDFEQALRLNPNHHKTKLAMLAYLLKQGNYRGALNYLIDVQNYCNQRVSTFSKGKKTASKEMRSFKNILSSNLNSPLITRIHLFKSALESYFKESPNMLSHFILSIFDEFKTALKEILKEECLKGGSSPLLVSEGSSEIFPKLIVYKKDENKLDKNYFFKSPKKVFKVIKYHLDSSKYIEVMDYLIIYQNFHPTCKKLRAWIKTYLLPQLTEAIEKTGEADHIACRAFAYFLSGQFMKSNLAFEEIFVNKFNLTPLALFLFLKKAVFLKTFVNTFLNTFSDIIAFLGLNWDKSLEISGDLTQTMESLVLNYAFLTEKTDTLNSLIEKSCNPENYLIITAINNFKANQIEKALENIKNSFNYEFTQGDIYSKSADIYSKRGLLLTFFVPDPSSFPDPFKDFKRALELNPNHVLTKRALVLHFLKRGEYKEALDCLLFLREFYSQISDDIRPCFSHLGKNIIREEYKEENKKALREIKNSSSFDDCINSYISLLTKHLKDHAFTMQYHEWSSLSLEGLKMRLEEKVSTLASGTPPSIIHTSTFVSNLTKKVPSLIQHQIRETEKEIFVDMSFKNEVIKKLFIITCQQFNIQVSEKSNQELTVILKRDEISSNKRVISFFKALQATIDAAKEPKRAPTSQPEKKQTINPDYLEPDPQPLRKKSQTEKRKQKTDSIKATLEKKKAEKIKEAEAKRKRSKAKKTEKKEKTLEEQAISPKIINKKRASSRVKKSEENVSPILDSEPPTLPLEGGVRYIKRKETLSETRVRNHPSIKPVNAVVPQFSELQQKNLECAFQHLKDLEDSVGRYFGKNNPKATSINTHKKLVRRELEYHLLRAFEAIDPTSTNHPLRDDPEYCTKIALALGTFEHIREIRNHLRLFFHIRTKWVFKFAIEFAKRSPSKTIFNLIEKQPSYVEKPLSLALKKMSSTPSEKRDIPPLNQPSEKNDTFLLELISKEFTLLKGLVKVEEGCSAITSFLTRNTNLPIIKKSLANIQKCTTFLTEKKFDRLNKDEKFQKIRKMGATIAHDIPDSLLVGLEDEVPSGEIFSLLYEDLQFFEEMAQLIN